MHIDLVTLRSLERERDIPFHTIINAIESALLTAYRHTPDATRLRVWTSTGKPVPRPSTPGSWTPTGTSCASGTTLLPTSVALRP